MRVTFLGHSGFFLELPEADLLFDYYKGNLPAPHPGKPLFVFVSHVHADHFSKKIFSLAERTKFRETSGLQGWSASPDRMKISGSRSAGRDQERTRQADR